MRKSGTIIRQKGRSLSNWQDIRKWPILVTLTDFYARIPLNWISLRVLKNFLSDRFINMILIFTAELQIIYPRSSYTLLSQDTRQKRCFSPISLEHVQSNTEYWTIIWLPTGLRYFVSQ